MYSGAPVSSQQLFDPESTAPWLHSGSLSDSMAAPYGWCRLSWSILFFRPEYIGSFSLGTGYKFLTFCPRNVSCRVVAPPRALQHGVLGWIYKAPSGGVGNHTISLAYFFFLALFAPSRPLMAMEKGEMMEEVCVLLRLLDFAGRSYQGLGLAPQALSWPPSPGLPCGPHGCW